MLFDAGGRIVAANGAADALAGRPLAGLTTDEAVRIFRHRRPDGTPLAPGDLPSAGAGGNGDTVEARLVITAADGRTLEIIGTASPVLDGDAVTGVLVVWRDITGQRRAEAALAASEERFRTAFEQSPLGMGLGDPDGRVLASNAVLEEMLGYGQDELRGISFAEFTHPDDLAREVELLRGVLVGEANRYEIEKRYVRRDGRTIWIRLVASLIQDAEGVARGWIAVHEDVTERRRIEAALVASNAELERQRRLLDTVLGALPYHVSVWGRDERLIWANVQFAASRDRSRDDLVGLPWRDLGEVSGTIEPLVRACSATMPAGVPVSREVEVPAPGGTTWHEVTVLPFGPDALLVITGDITARKETEAALAGYAARLEASEALARQRLREIEAVYDSAPVGLCVLDRDLRFVRLNRRFAEIDGVPVEVHLGRTPGEVVPDLGEQAEETLRRVLETGETVELEVCGETPADPGVVRYWDERWAPVRDEADAIAGVSISAVEVTERKRAEAALQESAATYRDLFMNDITGDFVAGADGRILDCNPAFARLFGFASVEEALASSIVGTYASPADRDTLLERIRKEGRIVNDERFRRRRDGTPVHVIENLLGIFDQDGTLVRTQGNIIDDTERHRAEAALREYAENLRRSNEDLERFAYVSSHDLQEPLRTIVSFSQLLERRYRGRLGQDADEYIDFIVEGGTRMQALIQDLLAYSRVNTKAQELRPTDVEIVLASVERSLDHQLREAGAVLTYDPLPTVTADPLQLEQVLMNLVSNAIKFHRPDEPLRIHVSARRLDGVWELSVRDNGIGIEEEYFDRIFVIFQRLHTKETYPGTGIGLAIVKRIVDRHGGTVRVESAPGEGTTFVFTLPAA